MILSPTDFSYQVKFNARDMHWEASVRELPTSVSLKIKADDPVVALVAIIAHTEDLRRKITNKGEFNVISGADWEKSLALAKVQPNDLLRQIHERTQAVLSDPIHVNNLGREAFWQHTDRCQGSLDYFLRGFELGIEAAR